MPPVITSVCGLWDRSRLVRVIVISFALLGLSVWATWPLVPHLGQFVNEDDPFISAWGLWWVADALTHFQNPWYTHAILAPDGSYLSFHAMFPLLGAIVSPLTLTIGAGLTYNILKLVLGPIAAATAYALGRTIGLPRTASWVVGCLWGFSIITLWRTSLHLNFGAGMVMLPVIMAFAVRYERDHARRDALLLGAALGATALIDPTMALFGAMAVGVWILISGLSGSGWRCWGVGVVLAGAVALVVASPQLIMMKNAADAGGYTPNLDVLASTWVGTNTNVYTMLSPGNVREWFPGGLEHEAYRYPWGEATPAYGWGTLVLALAGAVLALVSLVRRRRRRHGDPDREPVAAEPPTRLGRRAVVWGALVFLVGSVFALGPELTLRGIPYVPLAVEEHGQRLSALMPYTWLVQLPLFEDVRVPSRFVMLGLLGLVVLAGFGAVGLWRHRPWGRALVIVALLFALVESGFPDGGSSKRWVPLERDGLYAPVRNDRSASKVVDIPLAFIGATDGAGRTPGKFEPMLRATQNGGHDIAEGYVTRLSPDTIAKLVAHPFYAAVLAQQGSGPDDVAPLPPMDLAAVKADLRAMDVGWVTLWPNASKRVPAFLRSLGFTPVRRSDGIVLYRAPEAP